MCSLEKMQTVHFFAIKKVDNVANMSDNSASRAPVAQLDRASDYGSEGREFESSPARHLKSKPYGNLHRRAFVFFVPQLSLCYLYVIPVEASPRGGISLLA